MLAFEKVHERSMLLWMSNLTKVLAHHKDQKQVLDMGPSNTLKYMR